MLTADDVAAMLGLTRAYVYTLAREGRIPVVKIALLQVPQGVDPGVAGRAGDGRMTDRVAARAARSMNYPDLHSRALDLTAEPAPISWAS